MPSSKSVFLFTVLLALLYACKKESSQVVPPPDLSTFSGSYIVSGTHFNWHYYFGPGIQPYDSVVQNIYNEAGDTLLLSKVNDTTLYASLTDSGMVFTTQLSYKGHSSATGGYTFTGGYNGSPDFDSLIIYNGSPDSLYLFFSANLPHSGGDTYQMHGLKAH